MGTIGDSYSNGRSDEIISESIRIIDAASAATAAAVYMEDDLYGGDLREEMEFGNSSIAIVHIGDKEYEEFTGKFEVRIIPQPAREERTFAGLVRQS